VHCRGSPARAARTVLITMLSMRLMVASDCRIRASARRELISSRRASVHTCKGTIRSSLSRSVIGSPRILTWPYLVLLYIANILSCRSAITSLNLVWCLAGSWPISVIRAKLSSEPWLGALGGTSAGMIDELCIRVPPGVPKICCRNNQSDRTQ